MMPGNKSEAQSCRGGFGAVLPPKDGRPLSKTFLDGLPVACEEENGAEPLQPFGYARRLPPARSDARFQESHRK